MWTSGEAYLAWHLVGSALAKRATQALFEEAAVLGDGSFVVTGQVTPGEVRQGIGSAIDEIFRRRSGGRRWIDHTPIQTLMLPELLEAFPDAQFVHVVRDGRRVVESMLRFESKLEDGVRKGMQGAGWMVPWMRDGDAAVRQWTEYVSAAADFGDMHPERVHIVRHEQLEAEPEETIGRALAFLGLPSEPGPGLLLRQDRAHPSFGPDDDRSGVWDRRLRNTFERDAGPAMTRLGYLGGW